MTGTPEICDRRALLLHRARSARAPVPFLHAEAAAEIEERLAEINKAFRAPALIGHVTPPIRALFPSATVVNDAEHLELAPRAHDQIVHAFGLHWANDPVGQMVQARLALVPDGLFLGVMFGGATLNELRIALAEAETLLTGGLSPRVLPMGDVRELGELLMRAGFALPVADSRKLIVRYRDLASLYADLREMGETNALAARHSLAPRRGLFPLTEEIYRAHFSDAEGYLTATFEIVFLTGWAPAESQPKPLRPGSAAARLADVLGVEERQSGDLASPKIR